MMPMTREEAILEIEAELAEIQARASGAMDWKGEPNLREMAEDIYNIANGAQ